MIKKNGIEPIVLQSKNDILSFEANTLKLMSYIRRSDPELEFIAFSEKNPAFIAGYVDERGNYRYISSDSAESVSVSVSESDSKKMITACYERLAGIDLDISISVTADTGEELVYWDIIMKNRSGMVINDIQYPFIICSYELYGVPDSGKLLIPSGYGSGKLIVNPKKNNPRAQRLQPDYWGAWEFSSGNGNCSHYPGMHFAQFLAYYNSTAGLYLACDDTEANIKRFNILHRDPGIRLGVSHVGDWPSQGERRLEYHTLTCSFKGDWYDAADIYRNWSIGQKWFRPLNKRSDIPEWLIESPVYITIRPQGILDIGKVYPIEEFLPYEKCIPMLEKISEKVESPLAVILMGWEREGSWVQPESFPPVGGEGSMKRFIDSLREKGWHAGSFCNGTRWVIGHAWSGYDGRVFFDENKGSGTVCRKPDGSLWQEKWDETWRPSYACCMAVPETLEMSVEHVRHLISWGMESIQFFDQNNGSSVFPCFSSRHGHPPYPGKWMSDKMKLFIEEFHKAAVEYGQEHVIHSAESGLNETCLQLFQQTELRTFPPGYGNDVIPLYQYLFHECVVIQGMMGNAPEPYHLSIRNAVNCVLGGIPGGVLTGDGALLDKDTFNWEEWEPKVENSENAFMLIRNVTALRKGEGRRFLVFGRMQRPADIEGIEDLSWKFNGRENSVPKVFHSAWRSPDEGFGIVLCNWTSEEIKLMVDDDRLGEEVNVVIYEKCINSSIMARRSGIFVILSGHSCAVLSEVKR